MKRVFFGIFFFIILLISAVVHMPAYVGLGFVTPLPGGVKLDGVSGTLWNGSAASLYWKGQSFGSLKWELSFLRLFIGQADLSIKLAGVSGLSVNGHVGYSFGGAYAKDLKILAPAMIVNSYITAPIPISLSGEFKLSLNNYQLSKPLCSELSGNLTWSQAQVVTQIGTVDPGPVAATLSCNEGNVVAKGKSKSDSIESEFKVSIAPNQAINLQGFLKPGSALPQGIKNQLKWLGAPDAEGFYQLNFNN